MREINYKPPSSSSVFRLGTGLLGALIVVYLVFSSWYIVDQGERAVVLRLGAIVGEAGPGAHFKVPWIDTVRKITVQNQNKRYSALEAYSRDQQPANLAVSVSFVASDPSAVYEQYGDLEGAIARLIDPRVMSGVKTIFGQYDAVARDSGARGPEHRHQRRHHVGVTGPINIISVQVENIDFSEAYEQSVEQRMLAQVEIQRREQNLRTVEVEARDRAHARRRRGQRDSPARRSRRRGDSRARRCAARERRSRAAAGRREVGRQAADDDGAEHGAAVHQLAAAAEPQRIANLEIP